MNVEMMTMSPMVEMGQPVFQGTVAPIDFKALILQTMNEKLQAGTMEALTEEGEALNLVQCLSADEEGAVMGMVPEEEEKDLLTDLAPFMQMNLNMNIQYENQPVNANSAVQNLSQPTDAIAVMGENPAILTGIKGEKNPVSEGNDPKGNTQPLAAEGTLGKIQGQTSKVMQEEKPHQEVSSNTSKDNEVKIGGAENPVAGQTEGFTKSGNPIEGQKNPKETSFAAQLTGHQQGNAINQSNQVNHVANPNGETPETQAYSQISKEIMAKLEQKGPMAFKMQLDPESLGKIDVNLKVHEGKLIIDILAASGKTQALLMSQVDKLIQNMGLQNVQVESVQVNQQMTGQNQAGQGTPFYMSGGMDSFQRRGGDGQGQQWNSHGYPVENQEEENLGYMNSPPGNHYKLDYMI